MYQFCKAIKIKLNKVCCKKRKIDIIPPTQDALQQHDKRAVYQAGIWATDTQVKLVIPSLEGF